MHMEKREPSILIINLYFGKLPPWMNFLIETMKWNKDINWVIFTDGEMPENQSDNVHIYNISFENYNSLVREKLGIKFYPLSPYKLTDLRPALGFVHRDICEGYDFVGFGDIDVIYGNIRYFYTSHILNSYLCLSTHPERVSGHFFIMKNISLLTEAFREIPDFQAMLTAERHFSVTEPHFTPIIKRICAEKALFQERYSTPLPHGSFRWIWRHGVLSNEHYRSAEERSFLYLHFMNWHSARWLPQQDRVSADAISPWERCGDIVKLDWRLAASSGFMVSQFGIEPISLTTYP